MSEFREATADPFAAAFEKLSALGADAPVGETDTAMAAIEQPVEQPAAEPPAEPSTDVTEESTSQPPAEQPPAEQPSAEQPPAEQPRETPTESDDDLLRRLSELVRKTPPEEGPSRPEPKAAEAEPPIYTQEEQDFLQTYEKDWPDVAKAEALRRRAEYRHLATFIFQEVGQYLRPHLDALQSVAVRTHLSDLEARVPDYDEAREKVLDWVGTQPKYLQDAYHRVIKEGTVEEVTDLIGRWRQATGVTPSAAPAATAPRTTTVLPPATKQAAAALAPVGSKRSAPAAGVDPGDFDGAFAVAAAGKD